MDASGLFGLRCTPEQYYQALRDIQWASARRALMSLLFALRAYERPESEIGPLVLAEYTKHHDDQLWLDVLDLFQGGCRLVPARRRDDGKVDERKVREGSEGVGSTGPEYVLSEWNH